MNILFYLQKMCTCDRQDNIVIFINSSSNIVQSLADSASSLAGPSPSPLATGSSSSNMA